MTHAGSYELDDRYEADEGTVFLTGLQALARLPLEQLRADRRAGLHTAAFVSGYPGSPLGGFGEAAAAAAAASGLPVEVRPALNEEYAATAVMGSQLAATQPDRRYDGVVGIWYGKAPGVDRAADALRHAVFAGTSAHGGALAVVGDDPAAKSSTIPSTSAGLLASMHIPILYPGDPGEALRLGRHGIALSRATGLWVALKIVADVADATASVDLHPDAVQPVAPLHEGRPYLHQPDGRLLTPHTIDLEREIVEVRYELARRYAADNALNHLTVDPEDAWITIVASGISYREVDEALARLGLHGADAIAACGIRLLKMGMPLPFNASTIRRAARGVREVLVVEEKTPNIESLIKDALYDLADRPLVVGKHDEHGARLCAAHGALDADAIIAVLRRRLGPVLGERLAPEPVRRERIRLSIEPLEVQRTPFFCSGCPHNRSTEVPPGTLVGAGIGCHTMTLLMDPARVGDIAGLTCMGNEGTQWIGMAPFVERRHMVQNLGDGTFFHSGRLAVAAAVAAGVNITYKLLYNGTVAMTGGQDPVGGLAVPDVVRSLLDVGVAEVLVTTDDTDRYRQVDLPEGVKVWPRHRLLEAQERLAGVDGVTVLIHDQACAAEARRKRRRGTEPTPPQRVVINPRICEGCGDCGRVSNCLSVQPFETFFGRKTHIDQTTCNLDYSCLEGDCPSFMTVTTPTPDSRLGGLRRRLAAAAGAGRPPGSRTGARRADVSAVAPPAGIDDPVLRVPRDEFAMRITGIGGTGVVTVSQVLGTAAMIAGYHVRGLDQIGLSQKAGPVVSDVRMSRSGPTATNRLGSGQADLLLALDQLVAASDRGLLACDPARTTVVGSTSRTPTGAMITHTELTMASPEVLAGRIGELTVDGASWWADAAAVTADLFGSATTANLFVVGMAVQAGVLPIPPSDIEAAITLNGVATQANIAAFRWGRAQIWRPDAVAAARDHRPETPAVALDDRLRQRIDALGVTGSDADALVRFAAELVAWQDAGVAHEWLDVLQRVAAAEAALGPHRTLTMTVAANLFKLRAYKDEYEVARLMTDPDAVAEAFGMATPGSSVAWRLHPPLLRSLGLDRKIAIGTWATPAIALLARGKRLRGSLADPFRWTEVRKVERGLPGEYVAAVDTLLARLGAGNIDDACAVAALPAEVRGYEHIKLDAVRRYRAELRRRLDGFR